MPPVINGPGPLPPGFPLSSRETLARFGARIQITLSMPPTQAAVIAKAGGKVPEPVTGIALIDTGANNTCIDDAVARQLGLRQIGTTAVNTPAGSATAPQYMVEYTIAGGSGLWSATGVLLRPQGLLALIGTDALLTCELVYNGHAGTFTLSY